MVGRAYLINANKKGNLMTNLNDESLRGIEIQETANDLREVIHRFSRATNPSKSGVISELERIANKLDSLSGFIKKEI